MTATTTKPWWAVDLGQVIHISRIVATNRIEIRKFGLHLFQWNLNQNITIWLGKMILKLSSTIRLPFCLDFNVLNYMKCFPWHLSLNNEDSRFILLARLPVYFLGDTDHFYCKKRNKFQINGAKSKVSPYNIQFFPASQTHADIQFTPYSMKLLIRMRCCESCIWSSVNSGHGNRTRNSLIHGFNQ